MPMPFSDYGITNSRKERVSDMDISAWIIKAAIFGVLAAVAIGTFQNLYDAIKKKGRKENHVS
jgi:hypothetical protein